MVNNDCVALRDLLVNRSTFCRIHRWPFVLPLQSLIGLSLLCEKYICAVFTVMVTLSKGESFGCLTGGYKGRIFDWQTYYGRMVYGKRSNLKLQIAEVLEERRNAELDSFRIKI